MYKFLIVCTARSFWGNRRPIKKQISYLIYNYFLERKKFHICAVSTMIGNFSSIISQTLIILILLITYKNVFDTVQVWNCLNREKLRLGQVHLTQNWWKFKMTLRKDSIWGWLNNFGITWQKCITNFAYQRNDVALRHSNQPANVPCGNPLASNISHNKKCPS